MEERDKQAEAEYEDLEIEEYNYRLKWKRHAKLVEYYKEAEKETKELKEKLFKEEKENDR